MVTTPSFYLGLDGVLNFNGSLSANLDYPLVDYTGSLLSPTSNITTWSVGTHNGDSGHNYSFTISDGTGPGSTNQFELVVTAAIGNGSGIWTSNSDSRYGYANNWSSQLVPDNSGGNYYTATFGGTTDSNGQEASIVLEDSSNHAANFTVGGLVFTNTSVPYTVGNGSGSLTLDNGGNSGGPSVVVGSGVTEPTIFASLILGDTVTKSTTFNIAGGSILDISGPISESASHTGQSLTLTGGGTLQLDATNTYTGATNVSAGTLLITSTASIASTSISVSPGATLQLAGTTAALPSNANISNGTGSGAHGNFVMTGTATQTIGVISGTSYLVPDSNTVNATAYSGNTTVGDGNTAASLTATQILQNSLTINAGSTVTIAPSGGSMSAAPATSGAVASGATTADSSDAAAGGDPLSAIQAAISSGAISSTTGQVLENRIAAIERLAATDPGLDASLLESRVLAVLPASSSAAADSSSIIGGGSSLLALDSSALGSSSASAASGAFAPSGSFAGSPAAVPEPSTLMLAAMAAIGLIAATRRRRSYCNEQ